MESRFTIHDSYRELDLANQGLLKLPASALRIK